MIGRTIFAILALAELYRHNGIDANAILHAAQSVSAGRAVRHRKELTL
jgi:pyruvate dehydrogenase E1 component